MVNPKAPPADFEISAQLVAALLADQFPQYADLEVRLLDEGWDNVTFRLGGKYVVRLPRRREAVQLLVNEQTWLPRMRLSQGIGYSKPLHVGRAALGYPCPWSILPWFEGRPCGAHSLPANQAVRLAACLHAIHQPAAADAPANEVRGVPLSSRAAAVEERLQRLRPLLRQQADGLEGRLEEWWQTALAAPVSSQARWIHGDLHPLNILHINGEISALIDWGDISGGDVATDLACFWMLFDAAEVRLDALRRYGADADLISRSRGWAILFGAVLAESGLDGDARHAEVGFAALRRVAAEAAA